MSAEPSKDDEGSKAGKKQDELPLSGGTLGKPKGSTSTPPPANNQEGSNKEPWERRHSRYEIRIQLAILAFAIIACCVYYGQLKEMQNATAESTKATYIAQQSLRLDERAWISVLPKDVDWEEGKEYVVKLEIKNIGKTPAKKVESYLAGQFVQVVSGTEKVTIMPGMKIGDPSPDFTGEDAFLEQHPSPVFLIPQSPFSIEYHSGSFIVDKDMLERMKAGHATIFIWGKVTYDDIFGISHWISFCEVFDGHAFSLWKEHNDCDNNQ